MPELPEVQTVVNGLKETILGCVIESVRVNEPKIRKDNPNGGLKKLRGKKFLKIHRRGKNILIDLSGSLTLWVHLKMTGHLYYLEANTPIDKHDHLIIKLKNDINELRFNDYRKFGRVRLIDSNKISSYEGLAKLGPEPLEITADDFVKLMKSSSRMIKPALLDQNFIAGLGNIYADESLFLSRIHPRKLTSKIAPKKLRELHGNIQQMLKKAIRLMGTSVDSYAGVNGQPGGFQKYLQVYGREEQPCPRCGEKSKIRREKIGSRSAHFCPRCQRFR